MDDVTTGLDLTPHEVERPVMARGRIGLALMLVVSIALAAIAGVVVIDGAIGPRLDPGPAPVGWRAWRGDGFAMALPLGFDAIVDPGELEDRYGDYGLVLSGVQGEDPERPDAVVVVLDPGAGATAELAIRAIEHGSSALNMRSVTFAVGSPDHRFGVRIVVSDTGAFDLRQLGAQIATSFRSEA